MVTLPPPGTTNPPHAGVAVPAVGLLTVGRVAPPANVIVVVDVNVKLGLFGSASDKLTPVAVPNPVALVATMVYVAVPLGVEVGVEVDLVTANLGRHCALDVVPTT